MKSTFLFFALLFAVSANIETIRANEIPYGSKIGMNVTVLKVSGIGSNASYAEIRHTLENAKAYCTEYIGDNSQKCVDENLNIGNKDRITANCVTGEFSDVFGTPLYFRGANTKKSDDFDTDYIIFDVVNNEQLCSAVCGYVERLAAFSLLCPNRVAINSAQPAPAENLQDREIVPGLKVRSLGIPDDLCAKATLLLALNSVITTTFCELHERVARVGMRKSRNTKAERLIYIDPPYVPTRMFGVPVVDQLDGEVFVFLFTYNPQGQIILGAHWNNARWISPNRVSGGSIEIVRGGDIGRIENIPLIQIFELGKQ
jgi:hypothetical protein